MPSPMVRPGNGTPCSMAELSCWKVASPFGCTVLETSVKAEIGTICPSAARTRKLRIWSTEERSVRGTCGITW